MLDAERCYRIVCSRDPRFDGWFVTAVTSTGIYCRPSCPARTPKREHVRFHPTAAAAVAEGFRACRRCRPDVTPDSAEWQGRADVVARAMRLIADGLVDREGVGGVSRRLGYSERQLHRLLLAEVGAGALALARVQRAHTARLLLETTSLPVTATAFAAGFTSVRQFNDTVRAVYAATPTQLRDGRSGASGGQPESITLRLAARQPLDAGAVLSFLGARAVPGVEEVVEGAYRRVLPLPRGPGTVSLHDGGDHVSCTLRLTDVADLAAAVSRCRRLLDLDADPVAVDEHLGADPVLGPLVREAPGTRVPGHVDGAELAVRAVLGQQVSVAGARTLAARLVRSHGERLAAPDGGLTHLFPTPAALAAMDPAELAMPRARARALLGLARALDDGDVALDGGADRAATEAALLALPGIGPWTASYIALRALGDPDALPVGDVGLRNALRRLGHDADAPELSALADGWRPWRAYAVIHLWRSLDAEARSRRDPLPQEPEAERAGRHRARRRTTTARTEPLAGATGSPSPTRPDDDRTS
ncbi:MAG: Methylphosphotriester-DNA--protein-cysteine S-methyltransferase (EC / DNA-3-methyladenine glycosylase II [uncultured Acidimicrobiales bacterium]|uniref:DNA-3-methyladenine glycosylase II n=1 Tax=uncultured Acidimicrobiales bacterium TaxID=310071 RepID=A0A6J4I4Z5_9ACTN|nr:MAG: Methylphosphotriester-DNA--protein-cysteine S-methyltransferase (EC / DNA-3-methyladenine glycosylase II [uncultured Acidimicrobiales bacterium]